ncbi:hypothetical protein D3C84_622050 [compost metagenome]
MLDIQNVEKSLLNATGKFEYTVDGGAVVVPAYKYAHFDSEGDAYAVFIGRNTSTINNETGVYVSFQNTPDFWGVDVPLGDNVTASYRMLGSNWEGQTGSVTGFFRTSERRAIIQFDFMAHRASSSLHIKGSFILSV